MYRLSVYPEDNVNWMHVTKYENGKVRVTVDESEEERTGYVFVFPKALYDKIAEDPFGDNGLFEMNLETSTQQLKYEYTENNLLMNFVQKDMSSSQDAEMLEVTDNQNKKIEVTKVTEEGIVSDYGTDKIYSVESKDVTGNKDVTDLCEITEDGKLNIWIGDSLPLEEDIHIRFIQNQQTKIVLVIKK